MNIFEIKKEKEQKPQSYKIQINKEKEQKPQNIETNNKFNLLIAEKEAQAEALAEALGLQETYLSVVIPNKDYIRIEGKLETALKRFSNKEVDVKEMEDDYKKKGKAFAHLKTYQNKITQRDKYAKQVQEYRNKLNTISQTLEKKKIRYWKDQSNVLTYCSGHLIELKLISSEDDLNFETKLKPPSISDENKWLQFRLIEEYLDSEGLDDVVCCTDFDREGQVIFGSIIEYKGNDPSTCLRMKFSTLEEKVLQRAFQNLIPFDMDLYNAGKMRRWMDFVIGFNINPLLGKIYREGLEEELIGAGLSEEVYDAVKYGYTFNVGRVKLVVLEHIFNHTKKQVQASSDIESKEIKTEEKEKYKFYFSDNSDIRIFLFSSEGKGFEDVDPLMDTKIEVTKIVEKEGEKAIGSDDAKEIPILLNLTRVYKICSDLGASVEEVDRILQYLYLTKFISYPRSKAERWMIEDEDERKVYAHSVLDALGDCGYPIKDFYYDSYGNEGITSHSHPCLHTLPSITQERLKRLKKLNPLAFLVFNEMAVYTLKCFEKLPVVKTQTTHFRLTQENYESSFRMKRAFELVETNILDYMGYESWRSDIKHPLDVSEGDVFDCEVEKVETVEIEVTKNREDLLMFSDLDVINFLNENDIGTEATRPMIIRGLVEKQYLVSERVLLTTILGNKLSRLSDKYISFIDIDYTLEMEKRLNEIEKGELNIDGFEEEIKEIIWETYNNIKDNREEIVKRLLNTVKCHLHNVFMVVKGGMYGKFLQCPFYYTDEDCNQNFSI